jgi:hypothetical protein
MRPQHKSFLKWEDRSGPAVPVQVASDLSPLQSGTGVLPRRLSLLDLFTF